MQRRLERRVLSTLLTNKGRDDVVVLLDRAVGARRKGRDIHHVLHTSPPSESVDARARRRKSNLILYDDLVLSNVV